MKSTNNFVILIFVTLFLTNFSRVCAQNTLDGLKITPSPSNVKEEEKYYKEYSPDVISECFLLGIFGFREGLKKNQVASFKEAEEPLVDYLKKYIQETFNLSVLAEKEGNEINLYSTELSKIVDSYFNKTFNLKIELFDSNEKICSYLLGLFYRKGFKLRENIFCINDSFDEPLYFFLKKVGCRKILFLSAKYSLYYPCFFFFDPPFYLRKYFRLIEQENIDLHEFQKRYDVNTEYEERGDKEMDKMIERVFNFLGEE